jgi:8-amino-7-oxononanoate synthase
VKSWPSQLEDALARQYDQRLLRQLNEVTAQGRLLNRGDRTTINFAGNDYLALSQHPHLRQAASRAIESYGTGAGASRLISGQSPIHHHLEKRFAKFKHAEAALAFPTGYMANLALLSTLASPGDLICVDKLCHASLIDASKASGAQLRAYPHRNYRAKLERLLNQHQSQQTDSVAQAEPPDHTDQPNQSDRAARRFIVTDSIFSMDGDAADLVLLCDLADQYDAMLIVDEAHATGVLGQTGAGLCELQDVGHRVDVVVSTASKALGGLGGIVSGKKTLIDTLINFARPFIYTTAMPAAQAAAINAALDIVRDEPHRRARLTELSVQLRTRVEKMGLQTPPMPILGPMKGPIQTPIVPIIVGAAQAALDLSAYLEDRGIFATAIRPPTVAPDASRVRLTLRADMLDQDLDQLCNALEDWKSSSSSA